VTSKRILVVDDDPHLCDVVSYTLTREGYAVTVARDGKLALAALSTEAAFDLVVLDVQMPEMNGLEVCRRVRETSTVPIVFLSSRDEEIDRVVGLETGGDDYVTKPFSPRELAARVRAVLRRWEAAAAAVAKGPPADGAVKRHGSLVVDSSRHAVSCHGVPVRLTASELLILESFIAAPGRVRSRGELLRLVAEDDLSLDERAVDTHIKRLRKKLREAGDDPIETVYGVGYKLRESG
jgi:two-component system, OmpR family, response regulator